MNSHNHQGQGALPTRDAMQYLDGASRASGRGVDHQAASPHMPPFTDWSSFGGPFGFGGLRGRRPPAGNSAPAGPNPRGPGAARGGPTHDVFGHDHRGGRRGQQPRAPPPAADEKADGSDATADGADPVPDPAEVTPDEDESPPPYGPGRRRGRRGCARPRHAGPGCPPPQRSAPPPAWPGLPAILQGMMGHPLVHGLCEQAQRYAADADADAASFTPPVDVYNTETSYVVHVALPGARKEDLGVAWIPDTACLHVAGVVHRPGDEHFLATLASAERRVGLFDRHIALPPAPRPGHDLAAPAAPADPVDPDNISATMDNGLLVVVVPKLEREWTQIRRVDIE